MVKIKLKVNTIEGENLIDLDSEFTNAENERYPAKEEALMDSISELLSTVKETFGRLGPVVVSPPIQNAETPSVRESNEMQRRRLRQNG